jgi:hypothetical protein
VECFCSSTITGGASYLSSSSCNMPCAGDDTEICGGDQVVSVYTATTVLRTINFGSDGYSYLGCYRDDVAARTLPNRVSVGGALTPALCFQACAATGSQFAGLEYSGECCKSALGACVSIADVLQTVEMR